MDEFKPTEEQKKRIERNRLEALERVRSRQERLARESAAMIDTNVCLQGPLKVDLQSFANPPQPVIEGEARLDKWWKRDNSITGAKHQTPVASLQSRPISQKTKVKIVFQLDSSTTFSATANAALNPIYRTITGASYAAGEQLWKFPLSQYEHLLELLGPNAPSGADRIPKSVLKLFPHPSTTIDHPPRLESTVDDVLLESLYPFQREGIQMALSRHGKVILADDMGLGKSIQALGIAAYYKLEWPLLIITPASMVASWSEQVKRWLPQSAPSDKIVVAYDGKTSLSGLVNITSYDLAVKLLASRESAPLFRVIIADECHALRNADSKRSKTLIPILKAAPRAILLSGTPALNRPVELYPQIQAVQPALFPRFFDFGRRYCAGQQGYFGWDFKGASNLRELQLILEHTILIRRTKDAVLSQLPRKLRHQIFLKISDKELARFKKLDEFRQMPTEMDDEALESFQKRAEYMALWRRTAEIKLPAILGYIDDLLEAGHKMLMFAHHQTILDALEDHLIKQGVRSIRIDGRTPPSSRQDLCNAFQSEPGLRVALLSITAASTGITLTAATTVIFTELFWNPGVLMQAEDRAHRIGQSDSVNVHYLLAKGTTDDSIWPLLLRKLTLLESVGLGKNDFSSINKQEHDPAQMRIDQFLTANGTNEGDRKRTFNALDDG